MKMKKINRKLLLSWAIMAIAFLFQLFAGHFLRDTFPQTPLATLPPLLFAFGTLILISTVEDLRKDQ